MQILTLEQAKNYHPPFDFKLPEFWRNEVAKILNCTVLTLRNRERSGKYPEPKRNEKNNYRVYSFADICKLQHITYGQIYLSPILSVLYDKNYTDIKVLDEFMSAELTIVKSELSLNSAEEVSANG